MSAKQTEELRMDAYYYGFEKTGNPAIDKILSSVACAGKAYHHTECWNDEAGDYGHEGKSPVDWIQNAANAAATELTSLQSDVRRLVEKAKKYREAAVNAGIDLMAFCPDKECARYHRLVLDEIDNEIEANNPSLKQ